MVVFAVEVRQVYLHQRESPAVCGGRELRALRQVDNTYVTDSHTDRGGTPAPMRGQSDNIGILPPDAGRYLCYSTVDGYRRNTIKDRRIPRGIRVTGACHSLHFVGVQTRSGQINDTLAVGSPAGYDGVDVTCLSSFLRRRGGPVSG